jgi:hypothetical protein
VNEETFTIRLKIRNHEIELKGSREDVMKTLDELPDIVGKIIDSFDITFVSEQLKQRELSNSGQEVFPTIGAPNGISCPDAIIAILSTDWGRKRPRFLRDILKVMKVNALHFPIGTIKGRLTDLTKKGALRRTRGEKGYGYTIAK